MWSGMRLFWLMCVGSRLDYEKRPELQDADEWYKTFVPRDGKDYANVVPIALMLQAHEIDTLKQLQGVITRHDELVALTEGRTSWLTRTLRRIEKHLGD